MNEYFVEDAARAAEGPWSVLPAADACGCSRDRARFLAKRLFDIVMASLMLLAAAPAMAAIALLVKLDSRGPVFYVQPRVGINSRRRPRRGDESRRANRVSPGRRARRDNRCRAACGRSIRVIKFRTMRTDAEAGGPMWCRRNDPRVTRLGRWLRKSHLDELPQLFNVLRGDMSLVGPRPERPEFVEDLRKTIPRYEHRLLVPPGLTGLAQIRHRADLEVSDVRRKVRYDMLYLKKASVWTDVKIVLGTVPMVFGAPAGGRRAA
jgi:lipopolysaccharide/colanic/teichoic acid biosynthesis glycosyltransferase